MTWVWKYDLESRLQIGPSSDCANICSRATCETCQTKFTIHKSLIRPVLLYGSETCVLLVFEKKFLRTICGPKIEIGVYRRRYNHELDKDFDSSNALNVTKTNRLRYALISRKAATLCFFISNDVEISVVNIARQSRVPFPFLKPYGVGDNQTICHYFPPKSSKVYKSFSPSASCHK
jgi:hypothetical protein